MTTAESLALYASGDGAKAFRRLPPIICDGAALALLGERFYWRFVLGTGETMTLGGPAAIALALIRDALREDLDRLGCSVSRGLVSGHFFAVTASGTIAQAATYDACLIQARLKLEDSDGKA